MATGGAGGQITGGTSAGCAAGLGLCDDFESYANGMVPDGRWMMVKAFSTGASLMVDSTKASSGSKALHIKATFTNGGGSANIATKPGDAAFTGITNAGFLRFMMFQTAFTQPGPTHGRMVRVGNAMATAGSNGTGYAFSLHYQKPAQLKVEQMNDVYFGATAPVLDKWVCWEIQYGPGMLNWWMDGTKVTTPTNFPATTMLSMMEIGFETFTPITIEFWLDDVAFNSKRIGCPAK